MALSKELAMVRLQPSSDLQSGHSQDGFWPVADLDDLNLTDRNRCFSAVRDTLINSLNGQSFAGHAAEFGGY